MITKTSIQIFIKNEFAVLQYTIMHDYMASYILHSGKCEVLSQGCRNTVDTWIHSCITTVKRMPARNKSGVSVVFAIHFCC